MIKLDTKTKTKNKEGEIGIKYELDCTVEDAIITLLKYKKATSNEVEILTHRVDTDENTGVLHDHTFPETDISIIDDIKNNRIKNVDHVLFKIKLSYINAEVVVCIDTNEATIKLTAITDVLAETVLNIIVGVYATKALAYSIIDTDKIEQVSSDGTTVKNTYAISNIFSAREVCHMLFKLGEYYECTAFVDREIGGEVEYDIDEVKSYSALVNHKDFNTIDYVLFYITFDKKEELAERFCVHMKDNKLTVYGNSEANARENAELINSLCALSDVL